MDARAAAHTPALEVQMIALATSLLIGGGAALGAGESLVAADQGRSHFEVGDAPLATGPDPRADSLNAALTTEALPCLGQTPTLSVAQQTPPLACISDEFATCSRANTGPSTSRQPRSSALRVTAGRGRSIRSTVAAQFESAARGFRANSSSRSLCSLTSSLALTFWCPAITLICELGDSGLRSPACSLNI